MTNLIFWFLPCNQPCYLQVDGFYFLRKHGALLYPFLSLTVTPILPAACCQVERWWDSPHSTSVPQLGVQILSPSASIPQRPRSCLGQGKVVTVAAVLRSLPTHSEKDVGHAFKRL